MLQYPPAHASSQMHKTQLSSPPLAKTATFVTGLILTIDGTTAWGFPQADPRDL